MSDFSLTLVLQIKTSKIINDMAKVQHKSEKISAFGGIFFVLDRFDRILSSDRITGTGPGDFGFKYYVIFICLIYYFFHSQEQLRLYVVALYRSLFTFLHSIRTCPCDSSSFLHYSEFTCDTIMNH